MYDKKIAEKVEKLLNKNIGKTFKIKEIQKSLKIRKHKHKDLIHTLYAMEKERKIKLKNKKYMALRLENTELIIGIFDARSLAKNKSYAFVITDKEDIFIPSEDALNAYHGDKVEVRIRYGRNNRKRGEITNVLQRQREEFVGNVEEYKGKLYLVPDNTRIHTNFIVNKSDSKTIGKKVIIKITNWGNKELYSLPTGEVIDILGDAGNPDIEILAVIKNFELPLEFPEDVIKELKDISNVINKEDIDKRIDLRHLGSFTIDPISAKDFDDAISLVKTESNYVIYVHIADVAHYVNKGTALFNEAIKRGNSYYFPKKVIPMLPEKISNKICSLRPYEDKLTLTVETVLDFNFKILSQRHYESIINSRARLNYGEVDQLFDNKSHNIPDEIVIQLNLMRKINKYMQKGRIKRGYLQLSLPETEFIFNDDGYIVDLKRTSETESHQLIENFMLLANEHIAEILSSGYTVYRIHEFPADEKISVLQEILQYYGLDIDLEIGIQKALQQVISEMPNEDYHRVFDKMILRSLKKAKYSEKNYGHFGLAIQNYTHFTSPIRRLCDLVVHTQLKDLIHKRESPFSETDLAGFAKIATDRENVADESEREMEIKNKIGFMKKKIGNEYDGIIVAVRSSSLLVELNKYPVTGIIELSSLKDDYYQYFERHQRLVGKRHGKIYKLTDQVKILISRVSDDIYLQLV